MIVNLKFTLYIFHMFIIYLKAVKYSFYADIFMVKIGTIISKYTPLGSLTILVGKFQNKWLNFFLHSTNHDFIREIYSGGS